MFGPDSRLMLLLLLVMSVAALVAMTRLRLLAVRIGCGALSVVLAMTAGIVAVNNFYGYYTSWGQLWADFQGSTGNLGSISTASTEPIGSGRIGWVNLPGKLSGYDRRALVYLPPQYSQARYAHVRFPVVELFHGSPGSPLGWETLLHISKVTDGLIDSHQMGPVIVVIPSINGSGHDYQDCVNGPGLSDETYLLNDVRSDVVTRFRASRDAFEWGAAGYSSGGFCAANLALRHRSSFGAAAVINGYYRAADGPAGAALGGNSVLEAANSPLYLAEQVAPGSGPLPAFWVAAGTHDKPDYKPATVFTAALDRYQQVPFYKFSAADTANAWAAAVPGALTWLWQQLAPPDLRVLFPVRSSNHSGGTLTVPPVKRHPPNAQHSRTAVST
jgi:S-formylglutathione hydrolase FrmB